MFISKIILDHAVSNKIISQDQAKNLWNFLKAENPNDAKFDLINVAYYFGALLIIGAMTWFMGEAW